MIRGRAAFRQNICDWRGGAFLSLVTSALVVVVVVVVVLVVVVVVGIEVVLVVQQ